LRNMLRDAEDVAIVALDQLLEGPHVAALGGAHQSQLIADGLDPFGLDGRHDGEILLFARIFEANVYCKGLAQIPYSRRLSAASQPKAQPVMKSISLVIDRPSNGPIIASNRICALGAPRASGTFWAISINR